MAENTYGLHWSDDRIAELRGHFHAGLNNPQIAKAMGVTLFSVVGKLRRLGLKRSEQFTIWTDERIEELKRLFNENLSASETASKMGCGLTRLSIIGKWHRLGLKRGRKGTWRKPSDRVQVCKPTTLCSTRWESYAAISSPERLPDDSVVDVVPLHITLDDLSAKTCRWPYGTGPYTFCGCEVVSGPYCVEHASKAYEERPSKKRPAAKVLEREAA